MKINIGSIVKLNSGGPLMTVYNCEKEHISCHWYNSVSGEIKLVSLKVEQIEVVQKDDKSSNRSSFHQG